MSITVTEVKDYWVPWIQMVSFSVNAYESMNILDSEGSEITYYVENGDTLTLKFPKTITFNINDIVNITTLIVFNRKFLKSVP